MHQFEIRHCVTSAGRDVFGKWIAGLQDRRAVAAILLRVRRLRFGLFGDCRPAGGGVSELRVDVGAGYRVYFGRAGERMILLLCVGGRRRQHEDIARAKARWGSWTKDADAD